MMAERDPIETLAGEHDQIAATPAEKAFFTVVSSSPDTAPVCASAERRWRSICAF